ncbi:MAG: CRTAC1 family protein [Planctomycetales bacterium]|nr:CRTAC1 family protein [Planctomycetales bacterium]
MNTCLVRRRQSLLILNQFRFFALASGFLVLANILLTGCNGTSSEQLAVSDSFIAPDGPTAGTTAMAKQLATLVRNANPARTPSMGPKQQIAELEKQVAAEPDGQRKLLLQSHLGWYLLMDGRTEEAATIFRELRQRRNEIGIPATHEFMRRLRELSGLAFLRLAEQENCVANHNRDSCLMPIQGAGVHQLRTGAEEARVEFAQSLMADPGDITSQWLLNLAYMALGEYPQGVPKSWLIPEEVFASDRDIGRFPDVATAAGVDTLGLSGGVVLDDFDADGMIDIMASDWGIDKQLRVYRNLGNGTFQERTTDAGLEGLVGGLNLIHADFDNDGHVDVLVLRGAWLGDDGAYPNSLLRNLGNGAFDDVTKKAGVLSSCPTQTAAWADFDLDGDLDLFIGNETFKSKTYPCELFVNNGDGTFTEAAEEYGVAHVGRVKGVAWGDIDNDGDPDLYLSCFGEPNRLFRNPLANSPDGRFEEIASQAGVTQPNGSFPTWFWDFDNDGWEDLLVAPFAGFKFDGTSLRIVVNDYLGIETGADKIHLYRNNHDGTFTNVAEQMDMDDSLLVMGANFGDIDNDGFLDAYLGTGDPYFGTLIPNRMYRNAAAKKFEDVTTSGGFGHVQKGHGIAFADLDNDGDQDIYAVMGGAISGDIYQNVLFQNPGHGNHWITLKLVGEKSNRSAVGARIQVTVNSAAGERQIHVAVCSGGSFGASSLQQEIGLGDATSIERIEIRWPAKGSSQTLTGAELDTFYEIREGDDQLHKLERTAFSFDADAMHHHAGHQ